jgi:spore maturation protein CgeB
MKIRKRRRVPRSFSDVESGFQSGYQAGVSHGYHIGCCHSVIQAVPQPAYPVFPLRVLFIRQGFEALDRGVAEALGALVSELHLGDPADLYRLASEIRPDLVLVMNGLHVFPENHLQMVEQIRGLGLKTAVWFADDPYFSDHTPVIAAQYDYVFTHELSCLDLYREAGCQQVHYLPLAASTTVYRPMPVETPFQSDICFVGNGFPNRIHFFNQISPFLLKHKTVIMGALWERLAYFNQLSQSGRIKLDWTPVDETVKYYSGAKIVINLHRGAVDPVYSKNARQIEGRSINPRTYEIAACGAFQMTDIREDLGLYYAPGSEIVTYASPAEFVEKAEFYLTNEAERNKAAVRGLSRTHSEHTFQNRLVRLLNIVFGG